MAQALKRGRSRLVGLVVADVTNPFSVAVLRGAEKACQEAGYLLMLFNLGDDSQREREAIQALASYHVEGLILNTLGRDAGAHARDRDDARVHRERPRGGDARPLRSHSRADHLRPGAGSERELLEPQRHEQEQRSGHGAAPRTRPSAITGKTSR